MYFDDRDFNLEINKQKKSKTLIIKPSKFGNQAIHYKITYMLNFKKMKIGKFI